MDKKAHIFVFLLLFLLSIKSNAHSFKVIFVNPGHPQENSTGNFWGNVTLFMEAAANDLNIELVTVYAYRNHILMKSLVEQVVAQKPKYVVVVNEKGIALPMVKHFASHGVASFMLLNNLSNDDIASLTAQERRFVTGSVTPDNYSVGRKLLNDLVRNYKILVDEPAMKKELRLLALKGDYTTPASLARTQGFLDALNDHKQVVLIDSTVANWSRQQAYQKVKGILQHTSIDIIWTANDAMALGAKEAVLEKELQNKVIIGGINWDLDDSQYTLSLSYGGHVTLGAKSLVMLRDIDDNLLPQGERHQELDIFVSSINPHYSRFIKRFSQEKLQQYDFSCFSLSSEKTLPFSIDSLSKCFKPSGNQQNDTH